MACIELLILIVSKWYNHTYYIRLSTLVVCLVLLILYSTLSSLKMICHSPPSPPWRWFATIKIPHSTMKGVEVNLWLWSYGNHCHLFGPLAYIWPLHSLFCTLFLYKKNGSLLLMWTWLNFVNGKHYFTTPLQIFDCQKEKSIGKLDFSLAQLIKSDDMTMEQHFPLKGSGHNSTLTCKLTLKVNMYRLLSNWCIPICKLSKSFRNYSPMLPQNFNIVCL